MHPHPPPVWWRARLISEKSLLGEGSEILILVRGGGGGGYIAWWGEGSRNFEVKIKTA